MRIWPAIVLCGATVTTSAFAREHPDEWHEGDPPPPGFHYEEQMRSGAVVAGSVMFGVPYLISAAVATGEVAHGIPELASLYVPVVGPIITMILGASESPANNCCVGGGWLGTARAYIGLALDAGLQIGGAALFLHGLLSKKTVIVPNGRIGNLHVAPMVSPRLAGVSLGFSF